MMGITPYTAWMIKSGNYHHTEIIEKLYLGYFIETPSMIVDRKNLTVDEACLIAMGIDPSCMKTLRNHKYYPEPFFAERASPEHQPHFNLLDDHLFQLQPVASLWNFIKNKFGEDPIDFKELWKLLKEQDQKLMKANKDQDEPHYKRLVPIYIDPRFDVLLKEDSEKNSDGKSTHLKLAEKLNRFLQEKNPDLLLKLTTPIVARGICEAYNKDKCSLERVKNKIKGVFPAGTSGAKDISAEKEQNQAIKELQSIFGSMEFTLFS